MMLPVDDLKGASRAIAPNTEWMRNSREPKLGGQEAGLIIIRPREIAPLRSRWHNLCGTADEGQDRCNDRSWSDRQAAQYGCA
jgi:hypothetical protein